MREAVVISELTVPVALFCRVAIPENSKSERIPCQCIKQRVFAEVTDIAYVAVLH